MNATRVIIVEDEPVTARNLSYLLCSIAPDFLVVTIIASVKDCVVWFKQNPGMYDLVFMDIRLADGLSFDIFKQVTISRPVVFVTAYDDYALQAFKNNGIDYILKPFDETELKRAIKKYKTLAGGFQAESQQPFLQLIEQFSNLTKSYKKSFLVHYRDKLIPVETARISWFYTTNEIVYARTADNREYSLETVMDKLEQQLDPTMFFRANRQFIVNRNMITEVDFYFNGRLSVKIKPEPPEHILISKARVPEFKLWMNS